MAKQTETKEEARDQLWKQLGDSRVSMLSVPESGQHPQPMTHFADAKGNAIWFITSADTDLAQTIGEGADAELTLATPKQDYHASVRGKFEFVKDDEKLDDLWSPFVDAWFDDGQQDPKVRLLKLQPFEAAVWASQSNAILVGLKMMQASLAENAGPPDVGVHHVLKFG